MPTRYVLTLFYILLLLLAIGADWQKPNNSSTPQNFPIEIRDLAYDAGTMDYDGATNIPTGAMQYNRTADTLEEYNGSSFATAPISGSGLVSESVTSTQILNGTIATADIADGAVTGAKISQAWLSWTPSIAAVSSFTPSITGSTTGAYIKIGLLVCITWKTAITTTGIDVASQKQAMTITLPVTAGGSGAVMPILFDVGTDQENGYAYVQDATKIYVQRKNDAGYSNDTFDLRISGCYQGT